MANDAMREHWTESGSGWVQHEALFDGVFAPVTAEVLDTADVHTGQRVLDVGCGSGTLLESVAAAGGEPVGADISPVMVEAARARVPSANVFVADAQTADLRAVAPGPPFDQVVSRFGVMFFDDPTVAFGNIRIATAGGASLTFACWRSRDENPMFSLGTEVLLSRLGPQPSPDPDAPGPMSFADPNRVRAVLEGAGWSDVQVSPFDFTCDYGFDGTDGVEGRLTTVLATSTGRQARALLEPELGEQGWNALVEEVRAELRAAAVDGPIRFPGAVWLVTARH